MRRYSNLGNQVQRALKYHYWDWNRGLSRSGPKMKTRESPIGWVSANILDTYLDLLPFIVTVFRVGMANTLIPKGRRTGTAREENDLLR